MNIQGQDFANKERWYWPLTIQLIAKYHSDFLNLVVEEGKTKTIPSAQSNGLATKAEANSSC